jgi:hypothetical protein
MPSINTDTLIEYLSWMVIIYLFPTFISAALATTVINSERAKRIFNGYIEVINTKVSELILLLESNQTIENLRKKVT